MKDAIAAESNARFPEEACGLIIRDSEVVVCKNVAENPTVEWRIAPEEIDRWWGHVTAVWHSHPNAPAVPSEADQLLASPGVWYWIYSVLDEDLFIYLPDEQGLLQLVATA